MEEKENVSVNESTPSDNPADNNPSVSDGEQINKAEHTHHKDIKLDISMNTLSKETKKSFKTRTITAIILALVCVPLIVLGDWCYVALAVVFSVIAIYEFINVLAPKKFPAVIDIFTFIMTLSFIFWAPVKQIINQSLADGPTFYDASTGYFYMTDITISTLGVAVLILVLFLFALASPKLDVADVSYLVTMSVLISLCVQAITFLRFCPESQITIYKKGADVFTYKYHICTCLLMVYVALGAFMSDIGAYIFGIFFGKHKMNPRISPKKTWEGFVGGIVFSFIITFAFAMIFDAFNIPVLKGIFDKEHWYYVLLVSLAMPPVSVLGDLLFSTVKRHYKVKDFGNIFPGHGGVLDRIDSLLVTSLFVTLFIIVVHYFPFVG